MFRRFVSAALFPIVWWVRVAEHRRVLADLAQLDDRGLADIGLSRQDLRDATALGLGVDPSVVLAKRAAEREFWARRVRRPVRATSLPMAAE
ncbi:MAG: DUF1127 domain-containing protein [Pseudomonadota bacterium]|nr:DUF1127 domain-containing protein [Pseudomonadota bacterium]